MRDRVALARRCANRRGAKEEQRDGALQEHSRSRAGIFDIFRTFEYDFELIRRSQELGPEFPKRDENDPDGHPDEDWEVFRGRVEMLLLDENGDGFRVDQIMTYKLRLDADGLWKIIRWIDDPLSGDCGGSSKRTAGAYPWAAVKQLPAP